MGKPTGKRETRTIVVGPDGKRFAFPASMPREEMRDRMRAAYAEETRVAQEKVKRAEIDREATAAGRAEGERAASRMGVDTPFEMAMAAPAIGMAQQSGGRRVYNREGIVLPDEAAGLSALNSAGFFIPGMVNQRFGERLEEGRRQEPGFALAGDVAGGMIPGELIGQGIAQVGKMIAPQFARLGSMLKGDLVLGPERAVDPAKIEAAREAGFNTDSVFFRGLRKPIEGDEFYGSTTPGYELQGMGVSLSEDASKAAQYGDNVYPAMVRGKMFSEKEYLKRVRALVAGGMDARRAGGKVRSELEKEGYAALKADGGGLLDEGEVRVWENFDGPPNVRPVNPSPLVLGPESRIRPIDRPDAFPGDDVLTARALDQWTPPPEQQVRPMGFDVSRPRVAKRETREDTFFDDRLTPSENKAVEMRKNGYTAEEIADEMDTSRNTVDQFLFKAKSKGVDVGVAPKDRLRDDVIALKAQGLDRNQIAQRLGMKPSNVSVILSREKSRTKGSGLLTERGQDAVEQTFGAAYMSGTGSVAGGQYDLNGDGNIDNADLAIGSGIGLAAFASPLALRKVAELGGRLKGTRAQGMTPEAPRTPQQAVKFETPGSPEWEAAKAKGLDMSQAGRMARAKEMGFRTNRPYIHSTTKEFSEFKPSSDGEIGPGIYLSTPENAGKWDLGPNKIEVYVRGKIATHDDLMTAQARYLDENYLAMQQGVTPPHDDTMKLANADLQKAGFAGIDDGTQLVIFDPSNIRSVNAAFDPDKAASPILTAGVGGKR